MDLQQALDLFLELPKKPETIRGYRHALGLLIDAIGRHNDISLITRHMLVSYVNKLHQRHLSPHTINREIRSIKAFFNWLVSMDFLEASPADAIHEKRLAPAIDRDKAATPREMYLVAMAAFGHPRNYALIRFLEDTGCRAIELSRLKIQEIDFNTHEARVFGKGDRYYVVDFSDGTAIALNEALIARPFTDHNFVFAGAFAPHDPLTPDAIRAIVRRYCHKAGVRSLGTHAWRHAKGFALADQNTPVTIAAGVLGHANPETTMTWYYPHDRETIKRESRKAFLDHPEDTFFSPNPVDDDRYK
jgi:site-specific recombinase XerD